MSEQTGVAGVAAGIAAGELTNHITVVFCQVMCSYSQTRQHEGGIAYANSLMQTDTCSGCRYKQAAAGFSSGYLIVAQNK